MHGIVSHGTTGRLRRTGSQRAIVSVKGPHGDGLSTSQRFSPIIDTWCHWCAEWKLVHESRNE